MPQMLTTAGRLAIVLLVLAILSSQSVALPNSDAATIRTVDIGNGITLHYVDQGKGTPVIFMHGSLSDGGYWADQVGQFADTIGRLRTVDGTTIRTAIRAVLDTPPSLTRRISQH